MPVKLSQTKVDISRSMATKRKALDSPGTPSKKSRNVLTLADKVAVIEAVTSGQSQRQVAVQFSCGRTQVSNIMAEKETILKAFRDGRNSKAKYIVPRTLKYQELDERVYNFFLEAREKNIPVSGGLLQRQALIVSLELGNDDFTASNGWLESFATRHQLRMANLHGESADVDPATCDQWIQNLPSLLADYDLDDIYNCDETGVWFRSVPTKSYIQLDEKAKGVKVLKERITILVTASATGKKEKLWVIGRSKKPHSFPKYNSDFTHLFIYRNNKKAWMTTTIFTEYLNWLNNKMKALKRQIALLMDNCSAHPPLTLSNVKLIFLPKNTTSHLQPMDAGIIAWVKGHYRRAMMSDMCQAMSASPDVTTLAKGIKIWDAILNFRQGWEAISPDTIQKCFKKCGVVKQLDLIPSPNNETQIDDECTQEPVHDFQNLLDVPWDEYLSFDDQLEKVNPCRAPINTDESDQDHDQEDGETADEEDDILSPEDVLKQLKNIQKFCAGNEHLFNLSTQLLSGVKSDIIRQEIKKKSKQTSIKSFFNCS